MQKIIFDSEEINKIKKHANTIQKKLNVKLTFGNEEVKLEGDSFDEYLAKDVITALSLGFETVDALKIIKDNKSFKIIELKVFVGAKDLKRIRGRVIGKEGKSKLNLEEISDVKISIHNNKIGVIGDIENVALVIDGIMKLMDGAPHGNVYSYIQRKIQQMKIEHNQ